MMISAADCSVFFTHNNTIEYKYQKINYCLHESLHYNHPRTGDWSDILLFVLMYNDWFVVDILLLVMYNDPVISGAFIEI